MGQLICLNGPPFSGKTHLGSYLMDELSVIFPSKKISYVGMEHVQDNNKELFFLKIEEKLSVSDIVLAECVDLNETGSLTILCMPSEKLLEERYKDFQRMHGYNYLEERLIVVDAIEQIRNFMRIYTPKPSDMEFFNGENSSYILEKVVEYVISE